MINKQQWQGWVFKKNLCCFKITYVCMYVFWLHPWLVEVPGPGMEPKPRSDNAGSLTTRLPGNCHNAEFSVLLIFRKLCLYQHSSSCVRKRHKDQPSRAWSLSLISPWMYGQIKFATRWAQELAGRGLWSLRCCQAVDHSGLPPSPLLPLCPCPPMFSLWQPGWLRSYL